MKPVQKPKYPKEEEVVGQSKRSRPKRPWHLEKRRLDKDYKWEFFFNKYLSINHAQKTLDKELRNPYAQIWWRSSMVNDEFRLRNTETGEERAIYLQDNRILIQSGVLR